MGELLLTLARVKLPVGRSPAGGSAGGPLAPLLARRVPGMLRRFRIWKMQGKLEGIREGVSPWGGRPSGVWKTVDVSRQQNNLLSVKLGLKSYLLSRLFPAVGSEEHQSGGAGEGSRSG